MNKKILYAACFLVILMPFILSLRDNAVQSYTDFFIRGSHSSLESFYSWSNGLFGANNGGSIWRLFPLGLLYFLLTNVLLLPSGISQFLVTGFLFAVGFWSYVKLIPHVFKKYELNSTAIWISGFFYLFNPYTVTEFTQSFLLVIPYLLLPLQMLLLLRAFETKRFLKYALLLATLNAAVFGINLIFDVLSLLVLAGVALWQVRSTPELRLGKVISLFGLVYGVTLLLCSFWIVPQIYSSLIDTSNTQYVLNSEQFYNSDSSARKVLRGLGEWGFFSGQNGVPYNSFANEYATNPFVIVAGYSLPLLAMAAVVIYRKDRDGLQQQAIVLVGLLLLTMVVIMGTYQSLPTAGIIKWAFNNVPFAKAFRNTYKFGSISMLLTALLLALSLTGLGRRMKGSPRLLMIAGSAAVLVIVAINAFPFFTNQIYSKNIQITKIPDYWTKTAQTINKEPQADSQYVFMLPDQYFETLRWEGQQKSFSRNLEETLFKPGVVHNVCKGCGQYLTSGFLAYTYNNLSSPGIAKLLGMNGVGTIVQRNDYDYAYYKVQSPDEVKKIVTTNKDITKTATVGKLDLYKVKSSRVNPIFYSPNKLVATNTLSSFSAIAQQNQKSTGLVLSNTVKSDDQRTLANSNFYQPIFQSSATSVQQVKATATIMTPRSDTYNLAATQKNAKYSLTYTSLSGHYTVTLTKTTNSISVNGRQIITDRPQTLTLELGDYGSQAIVAVLQQRAFLLKPNLVNQSLGELTIDQADKIVNVYGTQTLGTNQVINGSLEAGLWQPNVANCNQTTTDARLEMKRITNDATDGTASLQLSAKDDSACTYTPALSDFQPGAYYFSFDAKRVSGGKPSYCVWTGLQCITYANIDTTANQWAHYDQAVYLDNKASNFYLYFYAQKANYNQTVNRYDNVHIYKLTSPLKAIPYTLSVTNPGASKVALHKGKQTFQTDLVVNQQNLVENGDFSSGQWQSKVQNCSNNISDANIGMSATHTGSTTFLQLTTDGVSTACTNSAYFNSYSRGSAYLLKFRYRVITGQIAKICIWNGSTCIYSKTYTVNDHDWHSDQELVPPGKDLRPISIYLYAVEGSPSEVQYTDINVQQVQNSFLDNYTLTNDSQHFITAATISYQKQNPTHYTAKISTTQPSIFIFSQSYHPGWTAYEVARVPQGPWQNLRWDLGLWDRHAIPTNDHVVANGFTNGWWLDPMEVPQRFAKAGGNYELVVDYRPQHLVVIGLIVSGVTLIGCIGYTARSRGKWADNAIVYKDPAVHHGLIAERQSKKRGKRHVR